MVDKLHGGSKAAEAARPARGKRCFSASGIDSFSEAGFMCGQDYCGPVCVNEVLAVWPGSNIPTKWGNRAFLVIRIGSVVSMPENSFKNVC